MPALLQQGQPDPMAQQMPQQPQPQQMPQPQQDPQAPPGGPQGQQGMPNEDLEGFRRLLGSMSMEQRKKDWPGIVKKISDARPDLAKVLQMYPEPPTDEDLNMLKPEADQGGVAAEPERARVVDSERALERRKARRPSKLSKSQERAELDISSLERSASPILDTLDRFEKIIDKYPEVTGFGSGLTSGVRKIGEFIDQTLGSDFSDEDKVAAREVLDSFNMDFVMNRIKDTKGSVSDKEMELFSKSAVGTKKSAKGNKELIGLIRSAEARKIEHSRFYSKYKRLYKTLDGAEEDWREYRAQYPIDANNNIGWFMKEFAKKNKAMGATAQDAINFRIDKYFK